MLTHEYGTASNIKSRVNRLSVLSAITSAQARLKLYHKGEISLLDPVAALQKLMISVLSLQFLPTVSFSTSEPSSPTRERRGRSLTISSLTDLSTREYLVLQLFRRPEGFFFDRTIREERRAHDASISVSFSSPALSTDVTTSSRPRLFPSFSTPIPSSVSSSWTDPEL